MSSLSSRIPAKLEENICATLETAKAKGDNAEFPAIRLKKILGNFVQENVQPTEEAVFRGQIPPISEVVDRYIQGLKEHEINVLGNLLKKCEDTEAFFSRSIEARVLALCEQNKVNLDKVVSRSQSHQGAKQEQACYGFVGPCQSEWFDRSKP